MSMPAQVLPPALREGDRLTRDEFLRRWDAMPDLKHAELIGGVVHMASPVSNPHGSPHMRLAFWLGLYGMHTPSIDGNANTTWLMSGDDVPQPDLAMRILPECRGQSHDEGDYPAGAPELVVEISHATTSKDAGEKLRLYERCGVREYLIAQTAKRRIVWRELMDGKYREIAPDADGVLRSRVFPGLWLDPDALWNGGFAGVAVAVQQGVATSEHEAFVRELETRMEAR